jgi:hypothetical protein
MNQPDISIFTGILQKPLSIDAVLQTNHESQKYGLMLTPSDALEIVAARNRSILDHNRVELGIEAIKKLISAFCPSPYINQTDYVSTLSELVDIFYYTKNLTEDRITDDELIALMQSLFDNSCRGSLDLLKNREMVMMAKLLRDAGL